MSHETILLGEYGSRAMGTNTVDSDSDFMGIAIESQDFVIGLNQWEQDQIKTALPGKRSGSGDVDQTIYSLRKWARLAQKGNPTVLTALFLPEYEVLGELGRVLIDNRKLFLSKEAGHRHLGYMRSQRDAMTGLRNKRTNRPELVHKYGYDTKFAGHMIRLGIQGIELMDTGRITIPLHEDDRKTIMSIREGNYSKEYVLDWSFSLDEKLKLSIETSDLPEETNREKINKLLCDMHEDYWKHGNF